MGLCLYMKEKNGHLKRTKKERKKERKTKYSKGEKEDKTKFKSNLENASELFTILNLTLKFTKQKRYFVSKFK